MGKYWQLLAEHRFRIHPLRWPMTFLGTGCAVMNSLLRPIQDFAYGRTIANSELVAPPVFIVGHWRSGTTLMHELLTLDDRVASATTLDAVTPHHLLVSKTLLGPIVNLLLPKKRPMDNMSFAGTSPQEDDFALLSLGAPTLYRQIAFPNERQLNALNLDPELLTLEQRNQLRDSLCYFYRVLTARYKRPLVLKSPPHTARLASLDRWFPGAKFIHISRHPYRLVSSTLHLWRSLDDTQGFQIPKYSDDELMEYIHRCSEEMYRAYFRDRSQISASRLVEVQFEQLVADPVNTMQDVLDRLEWPNADRLLAQIENYFEKRREYNPVSRSPESAVQSEVDLRWQEYMEAFQYQLSASSASR